MVDILSKWAFDPTDEESKCLPYPYGAKENREVIKEDFKDEIMVYWLCEHQIFE
jgi:hypothetical protein